MSSLAINKTQIINIDKERHLLDKALLLNLRSIIEQTYQLPRAYDIFSHYLDLGPNTVLVLFYGEYDDLAGFAAVNISRFTHEYKQYAIYQANALFDPLYHDSAAAEKYGLTHAMKYKLTHPETILAYVGEAITPVTYIHYSRTVKTFYPHPNQQTPAPIKAILNKVKQQRQLHSVDSEYCVKPQHCLKLQPKISQLEQHYQSELVDYYKSLNPGYLDGSSLLVYIPLDLTNISLGLRNVISPQIEFSLI